MNLYAYTSAIELGLIFSLVGIGVFFTFRVLDFPDLTVDGSFPLGAAVSAVLVHGGWNPWLALLVSLVVGSTAGLCTAWLHTRLRVVHLLASIVTMTALYSVNLRIMGRPNLALLEEETIFSWASRVFSLSQSSVILCVTGSIVACVLTLAWWFLRTELGLALRASGNNPIMARAMGVSTHGMIWLGLGISNGLAAFAGGLYAQAQGSADVGMGIGTVVAGLAAVIIGEALLPTRRIGWMLVRVCAGSILYRVAMALALSLDTGSAWYSIRATDLNLVTAGLVVLFLAVSQSKKRGRP